MSGSDTFENDRRLALVGMLTGDKVLSNVGEAQLRRAYDRTRGRIHVGDGFFLDKETGSVEQDPGYASFLSKQEAAKEARATRLQEQMLERMTYGSDLRRTAPSYENVATDGGQAILQTNPEASGGAGSRELIPVTPPLSGDDRQKAAESERLANEAASLYRELQKVQGVVSSPKDIASDVLNQIPVVGGGASRAAQESMFSPQQQLVRSRGARFEQNLSNLAAGMALTGYELEQRNRWSPFATGVSQDEAQRRLQNIQRDFGQRRDTIVNASRIRPSEAQQPAPPARKRVRVDYEGNVIGD